MKLFDRLLDDLADRIADRLLAATPTPVHIENMHVADDRYTDFERSLMAQRDQRAAER